MMTEQIRNILDAARSLIDRPSLGRVEVGSATLALLKEAARTPGVLPESPYRPMGFVPPTPSLLGVPVTIPDDIEPTGWRLLDTDGEVIKSGHITFDVPPWWEVDRGRTS